MRCAEHTEGSSEERELASVSENGRLELAELKGLGVVEERFAMW